MEPEGDITSAPGGRKEVDLWEGGSRGKMGGGTRALTNNSQETFQPCRAGLVTMAHWRGTPECYDASR